MLNNDNDESRKMVEQCYKQSKTVVNPIIDWTDGDVWEFIHEYNVPYCKLYDEGFTRIGCIGCPMSRRQQQEFNRYPKYKRAYIKAFDKMLKNMDGTQGWQSGEEVMEWWMSDLKSKTDDLQINMENEDDK